MKHEQVDIEKLRGALARTETNPLGVYDSGLSDLAKARAAELEVAAFETDDGDPYATREVLAWHAAYLEAKLDAALDELAALRERGRPKLIAELPRFGSFFHFLGWCGDSWLIVVADAPDGDEPLTFANTGGWRVAPTHWLPLPEAPR